MCKKYIFIFHIFRACNKLAGLFNVYVRESLEMSLLAKLDSKYDIVLKLKILFTTIFLIIVNVDLMVVWYLEEGDMVN